MASGVTIQALEAATVEAHLFGTGLNLREMLGYVRRLKEAFARWGLTPDEIRAIVEETKQLIENGVSLEGVMSLVGLLLDSFGDEPDDEPATVQASAIDAATLLLIAQLAAMLAPFVKEAAARMRERIKERRAARQE